MVKALMLKGYLSTKLVIIGIAFLYGVAFTALLSGCAETPKQTAGVVCTVEAWDNGAKPVAMGFRMQELTPAQLRILVSEYNNTPPKTDIKAASAFLFIHPANSTKAFFTLVNGSCIDGFMETDMEFVRALLTARGA